MSLVTDDSKHCLYSGNRQGCLSALAGISNHYTYILRRPDGRPFYVGKGVGHRVFHHENEARHPNDRKSNRHKLNVIRSISKSGKGLIYEIDREFLSAEEAFVREEELIRRFRRLHEGGTLTNRHPGGGSTAEPSPFSKERHRATLSGIPEDDPETAALNRFVLAIGDMRSVVLKPISRFSPRPTQVFPRVTRKPSLRQAVALAAAAAANGLSMDGECEIPRRVEVDGVAAFVENGVSCDIATSGMATVVAAVDPADEKFVLDGGQGRVVVGWIGIRKAVDLGITGEWSVL